MIFLWVLCFPFGGAAHSADWRETLRQTQSRWWRKWCDGCFAWIAARSTRRRSRCGVGEGGSRGSEIKTSSNGSRYKLLKMRVRWRDYPRREQLIKGTVWRLHRGNFNRSWKFRGLIDCNPRGWIKEAYVFKTSRHCPLTSFTSSGDATPLHEVTADRCWEL